MLRWAISAIGTIFLGSCNGAETDRYDLDDAARLISDAASSSLDDIAYVDRRSSDEIVLVLSNKREVAFYLGNLLRDLNLDPKSEQEIVGRYVSGLDTAVRETAPLSTKDLQNHVILIVRSAGYVENLRKAASRSSTSDEAFFFRHLAGDYWVILAVDLEHGISPLRFSQIGDGRPQIDDLFAQAAANLRAITEPRLRVEDLNGIKMIVIDGNYESSMLLLDEYWRSESGKIGDSIIAVAVARDVLMYCPSSNPDCVERLRNVASEKIGSFANAISTVPIIWRDGAWTEFTPAQQ